MDIPNILHLLCPKMVHAAQDLWNNIALIPEFISREGSEASAWVCDSCNQALTSGCLLKLSLANNLWIGKVPHELAILTLPEQLLVLRHFPQCYVVKLYPRDGHVSNTAHLQHGIIGNVTLYNMNMDAVSSMLEGQLLLHPAIQLSSVLVVTYIGLKKLPKSWLKATFRVRRCVVYEALVWLKRNNMMYKDIIVSSEWLQSILEDDVPYEITVTV